jgi:hypothetical protein
MFSGTSPARQVDWVGESSGNNIASRHERHPSREVNKVFEFLS